MATLSTYWSPSELQGLQRSLVEQERILIEELKTARQERGSQLQAGPAAKGVGDTRDSTGYQQQVDEIDAKFARLCQELNEVDFALRRLYRGVFGVCVHCHQDIPAARLRAQPSAARCLSCQQAHEHVAQAVSTAVLAEGSRP